MTHGELVGFSLIVLGLSGILFITIYQFSILIPHFIAQHGRLSCIGFFSFILVVIGGFVLGVAQGHD